jgi:hypothetical protein
MSEPLPDLSGKFQEVFEETAANNLRALTEVIPDADAIMRCCLQGGTAWLTSMWYAIGQQSGDLAAARAAYNAMVERFWGQMVIGAKLTDEDEILPLAPAEDM